MGELVSLSGAGGLECSDADMFRVYEDFVNGAKIIEIGMSGRVRGIPLLLQGGFHEDIISWGIRKRFWEGIRRNGFIVSAELYRGICAKVVVEERLQDTLFCEYLLNPVMSEAEEASNWSRLHKERVYNEIMSLQVSDIVGEDTKSVLGLYRLKFEVLKHWDKVQGVGRGNMLSDVAGAAAIGSAMGAYGFGGGNGNGGISRPNSVMSVDEVRARIKTLDTQLDRNRGSGRVIDGQVVEGKLASDEFKYRKKG